MVFHNALDLKDQGNFSLGDPAKDIYKFLFCLTNWNI